MILMNGKYFICPAYAGMASTVAPACVK